MVRVKLFANLREIVGRSEVEVEAESVIEVLRALSERFPRLKDYIFKDGDVNDYIKIAVNGKIVESLNVRLSDDDVVAIFPPFSGG